VVSLRSVRVAPCREPVRIGGGKRKCRSKIRNTAVVVSFRAEGEPAIVETAAILRIELGGFAVVGDGAVVILHRQTSVGAPGVSSRIAIAEPDCVGKVGDRTFVVLQRPVGNGAVMEGGAIVWVEADRLGVAATASW
jgi:hypothetical protein